MYVDTSIVRSKSGKTYTRHLLRESFRKDGKVKHRTIANISHCSDEEIEAMRLALRCKHNLAELVNLEKDISLQQGLSVGAVWTVFDIARQLGIAEALGHDRNGKLALWQVIARVIDQGSRLSAVRLAGSHAACDVLGLSRFDEDDLYANLDWLCENQPIIEARLFGKLHPQSRPGLFLYDVTSSYLEGLYNELAAFGYNRDGKPGKKQIVIGLLCNQEGTPLSVEVFRGNTTDPQTFGAQVTKVAERFGGGAVTFVGDRGMIKSPQIKDLPEGFHYITAITKPQIESLLSAGTIQLELFDEDVAEIHSDEGVRYILRCNPVRRAEIAAARRDKLASVAKLVDEQNGYLATHRRARVAVALRKIGEKIERLRLGRWVRVSSSGRTIELGEDAEGLAADSQLDGCYVLKTDLDRESASKETVHERYKDLAQVEWAFRTCKTVHLQTRPIHVRLASRTRGHVLVVMLAYRIVAELARRWQDIDATVAEGIDELGSLSATLVSVKGQVRYQTIPQPRSSVKQLLAAADVRLPAVLPSQGVVVTTKRKLPDRRQKG